MIHSENKQILTKPGLCLGLCQASAEVILGMKMVGWEVDRKISIWPSNKKTHGGGIINLSSNIYDENTIEVYCEN